LRRTPDYPEAVVARAGVLTRLRQDEAALAAWERVVAREPRRLEAVCSRALMLSRLGRANAWPSVMTEHGDAITGMSPPGAFLDGLRENEDCRGALKVWLENAPTAPKWNRAASLRGKIGDAAGALEAMKRAVYLEPLDGQYRFGLGEALAAVGRIDDAAVEWQKAIDLGGPTLAAKARLDQHSRRSP
jgi:Flp pilus assembly protein TadD